MRGAKAFRGVRVGACADELRLMGVGRDEESSLVADREGGGGSLARNSSSACVPSAMERMWSGPWGDGANCTMQFVESDGRRRDRRCDLVGRLVVTKGSRSEDGMESSRLVIDSMSKPREYCSRASSKVQCSGPHCTRYSSTHVLCRPCRTRLGLLRARMRWIEALSPGASLPLRGSIVVVLLLLEELCLWDAPFFFLEGIFSRILIC